MIVRAWRHALMIASLWVATPLAAAEPRPLFAEDSIIHLEIRGPFRGILRGDEDPVAAALTLKSKIPETHAIRLSPRGITRRRRDICTFPPLRLEFSTKPGAVSLFYGQKRLKLVTHCRPTAAFQQYVLLEYAAYRLFNIITPFSFRTRLAQIDYIGEDGKLQASRRGFFIEDIDDVAWRNQAREASVGDGVATARLSPADAATFAIFQYMIGNLDWSMNRGPEGQGCCHNSRLITPADANGPLIPVPYDFDFSGLVDAPYAVPPNSINLPNVRVRRYRGYCRHNAEALAAIDRIRSRQMQLQATLAAIDGLDPARRRRASAYLDEFFRIVATKDGGSTRLLKTCLR
ncbi:MAG TPA: hypothetical protein VGW34_08385 [Allosphingosinicella sp.]|nr:hypothetical protein [Allosphingosinicella sp.]